MKGFIIFIVLVGLVAGGYFIFKKPSPAPESPTPTSNSTTSNASDISAVDKSVDGTKDFDTVGSEAHWTGSKTLIKDYYDYGTIGIKSGNAVFAKGILTGGTIVFDMNSIATISTGKGDSADATSGQAKHLKSPDFFDTAKYPEAKFVVTNATKQSGDIYLVTGDLTIKDKTNSISFPAVVAKVNGKATVSGSATIDRTLWEIKYGSDKFFADLGDKVINDKFTLEFKAVTK